METEQAPNIDLSAGGGRLVYDKSRRTIVSVPRGQQSSERRHSGGWPRIHPYDGWRARAAEAWWVLTGRFTLHRAWQTGYDQHIQDEGVRRSRTRTYEDSCIANAPKLRNALNVAKAALITIRACSIKGAEEGYGKPEDWSEALFRSHSDVAAALKTIDAALER